MKLCCPICGEQLNPVDRQYLCPNRHSFDIARQGYVNLLTVQQKHSLNPGDTREQVLSRREFLEAGFYAPIAQVLVETAKELGISLENHHRAVDDAGATAEIYVKFLAMLKEQGITSHS